MSIPERVNSKEECYKIFWDCEDFDCFYFGQCKLDSLEKKIAGE